MNDILVKMKSKLNKAVFCLKKHSPEILAAAGVAGTVTAAVLACKATTKVSEILGEAKDELDKVHECAENEALAEEYSEEDQRKDTTIIYIQTGVKLVKLYAPAVALGTLSLMSLLASNDILRKRNAALAAAYAAVDESFKAYKKRVADRFGDETEREIRYGIKAADIFETVTDENGKEETVTKTVNVFDPEDPNTYSPYAKFFDETNDNWEKDSDYNLMFLKRVQSHANDMLIAKGRLFLNEVYDMLGFPQTKAGQVVGWVYDPENPIGDNYVDFGIYDIHRPAARNFVNGYERVILLDFNVDGNIWELM